MLTLFASCSQEDSITLTPILDDEDIIQDDFFILRNSAEVISATGAYVTCTSRDSLFQHALAYSEDLVIEDPQNASFTDLSLSLIHI